MAALAGCHSSQPRSLNQQASISQHLEAGLTFGGLQELKARVSASQAQHAEMLRRAQDICIEAEDRAAALEKRAAKAEARVAKAEAEYREAAAEAKRLAADLKVRDCSILLTLGFTVWQG